MSFWSRLPEICLPAWSAGGVVPTKGEQPAAEARRPEADVAVRRQGERVRVGVAALAPLALAVPTFMAAENASTRSVPVYAVTTTVDVDAPPAAGSDEMGVPSRVSTQSLPGAQQGVEPLVPVMAKRANAHTTEINSSHASYISHPAKVTKLILRATRTAR